MRETLNSLNRLKDQPLDVSDVAGENPINGRKRNLFIETTSNI